MAQISQYRHIHIIGGAGSGKTTLAKQLADHFAFPCYHLDQISWDETGKVPLDKRLEAIAEIVILPGWITEGAYLWWAEELMNRADVIVWLDLPFRINAYRMVKRHIQADLAGSNQHPGIRNLIDFMAGVYRRHRQKTPLIPKALDDDLAVTRAGTVQVLAAYSEKTVHCHSPRDVERFLDTCTSA